MSRTPAFMSICAQAMPAAPAPEKTTFTWSMDLPTTRSALVTAAMVTMAVPCWSSWNTGMPMSWRRSSMSKQRGAEISSRLMPPNDGARFFTIMTISSESWVSSTRGMASTPPSSLKRTHLPSMTGMAPSGPRLPRPRTAEPSLITATVRPRPVSSYESSGLAATALLTWPTPGVYASERSSAVLSGMRDTMESFPRCLRCSSIACLAISSGVLAMVLRFGAMCIGSGDSANPRPKSL